MATIVTSLYCNLQSAVKVQYLDGNLFSQDNQANRFDITVLDGVDPATISGSVSADVIRADGGTVAVTGGTISGNVVSISFPAAVYAIPGVVSIVVKLTESSVVTTIAAVVATVYKSSTDTPVDPGTIIPSVTTLIADIEAAVASIPADYSSLWTSLAPAFSPSASYVAGQYVTYNGGLYRFNTTHSGAWASGDVSAVNIGGELSSLKSALNVSNNVLKHDIDAYGISLNGTDTINIVPIFEQGSLSSGQETDAAFAYRVRSGFIPLAGLTAIKISVASGYLYEIDRFDADKAYKNYRGWLSIPATVMFGEETEDAHFVRIVACKESGTITPEEIAENITITAYKGSFTDNVESTLYNYGSLLADKDSAVLKVCFEQGSLSSGQPRYSDTRIRSPFIRVDNLASLHVQALNGYYCEVDLYDSSKTYKSYYSWSTAERVIYPGNGTSGKAAYIRILLAKESGDITPSDAEGNISVVAYRHSREKYDFLDFKNEDNWSYGSRSSDGTINSSNAAIVCDFKKVRKGDVVFSMWDQAVLGGKYLFDIVLFDSNMEYISGTGWHSFAYTIPQDCYMSVSVKKRSEETITSAEKTEIISEMFYTSQPKNMNHWEFDEGTAMKAINHRGWGEAPENTLAAYRESYQHGFRFVETDIRFTKDQIPVCSHDNTLNRVCRNPDGSIISETVALNTITYAETQYYDAGIYRGEKYAGEKIPTMGEFLDLCRELNLLPYIDMGSDPEITKAQLEIMVETVSKHGMTGRVTYIVPTLKQGIYITQMQPNQRICNVNSLNPAYTQNLICLMTGQNQVFCDTYYGEATDERIEICRGLGLPVEVWTVNDTEIIDALNPYISGVTSDLINVNEYLQNKEAPDISPSIMYSRATDLEGGYLKKDNSVKVHVSFVSAYTASDTPRMLDGFIVPKNGLATLQCVEYDDESEEIAQRACIIINDQLFVDSVTTGKTYVIDGVYQV